MLLPSKKHRIFWGSATAIAIAAVIYLIIPPMLNLNRYRSDLSNALTSTVGKNVEIMGDVRVSLLGHPMLIAKDVRFSGTRAGAIRFRVTWGSIFDMRNARITGAVKVSDADIKMTSFAAVPDFGRKILLSNAMIDYQGKKYEILNGVIDRGALSARIRTDQHKYDLVIQNGNFMVTNPNEDLDIKGILALDDKGVMSAKGMFSIDTTEINKWFNFVDPVIKDRIKLSMNFDWDGNGNFDFSDIKGTSGSAKFNGHIRLKYENGVLANKVVRMVVSGADADITFLRKKPEFFNQSDFNIVFKDSRIKTGINQMPILKNLSLDMSVGDAFNADIRSFKADDSKIAISATGHMNGKTADNLGINLYEKNQSLRCILSGDMDNWQCSQWSFANKDMTAVGTLFVSPNDFKMVLKSNYSKFGIHSFDEIKRFIGKRDGDIKFTIGNGMDGTAKIRGEYINAEYTQKETKLSKLSVKLPLPEQMMDSIGDIAATIDGKKISFVFRTPEWTLSSDGEDGFSISHKDAKEFLADLTGQAPIPFIKDNISAIIVGKYNVSTITNLNIQIAGTVLSGTFTGMKEGVGQLALKTPMLDLDQILDANWFGDFSDNQYLTKDPTLMPFFFGTDIAITADKIKYRDTVYDGFVYSLLGNSQNASISDSKNGGLVFSVSRDKNNYHYLIQLNKFFAPGFLFSRKSSLNISGTTVTAQAELDSFGLTAYDIRRNMSGIIDASLDGGIFYGIGTDNFYNNVNSYSQLDEEDALTNALDGGQSMIKEMEITGEYSGGDFTTTKPFLLTLRHTDITGNFRVKNDIVQIRSNITLRGTNPVPKPIAIRIEKGKRDYSIADILPNIDLDYLREFVANHKKF